MDTISLIIPCYNEEETLELLFHELSTVASEMKEQKFEFLFIDDGSNDNTLEGLKQLRIRDERVRFISFSRNFGKESSLLAGLQNATGNYVAVLDADLQDPPSLLKQMYEALKEGKFDCVATRRKTRKGESPIRSFFARIFYKLINKISKVEIVDGARDFRMMNRKMVDAILTLGENNRFSKGIFSWVGFETKWISYENVERAAGKTKWSFWGLFVYALDGLTAFSTAPLVLASVVGLVFFCIAFVLIAMIIVKTMIFGNPVPGYPSLICVIFFIAGIQLFCIGIIGQYLSKVYLETKKRPVYIEKCTEKDMDFTDDLMIGENTLAMKSLSGSKS